MICYLCLFACKSLLEHWYLYIVWAREDIFIWPENQRSSIFTPPALSTGIWEELPQSSIRDLLQCWMRRDTHTANDGMGIFPLELCPAKSLYCVYQELATVPWNVAMCEPVDLSVSKHEWSNFYKHSTYIYIYITLKVLKIFSSYYACTWLKLETIILQLFQ